MSVRKKPAQEQQCHIRNGKENNAVLLAGKDEWITIQRFQNVPTKNGSRLPKA